MMFHYSTPGIQLPETAQRMGSDDTWNGAWNSTNLSSIHTPQTVSNITVIKNEQLTT